MLKQEPYFECPSCNYQGEPYIYFYGARTTIQCPHCGKQEESHFINQTEDEMG